MPTKSASYCRRSFTFALRAGREGERERERESGKVGERKWEREREREREGGGRWARRGAGVSHAQEKARVRERGLRLPQTSTQNL